MASIGDGYSEPLVFAVCASLCKGRVLQRADAEGRVLSAGTYRCADQIARFALLSWPYGCEEIVADAYDVATAFIARLAADVAGDLFRELTADPERDLIPLPRAMDASEVATEARR